VRTNSTDEAGFTLIETLVALALTGLILSALATITAQWLPNWNRGIDRVQRSEEVSIAMERIAADLAAADFVPANRDQKRPLFDGSPLAVTFVRTALGPNTGPGLEVVRIGETTDQGRLVMVRSRAPFGPLPLGSSLTEQIHVANPVVLLRPPYRLLFSYAGPDRVWRDSWHEAEKLPASIMIAVRDAASGRVLPYSTVAVIHTDAPADAGNSDPSQAANQPNQPAGTGNNGSAPAAATGSGGT
jgi:general secretion pathway protein J